MGGAPTLYLLASAVGLAFTTVALVRIRRAEPAFAVAHDQQAFHTRVLCALV